jgi:hypothetical protein
VIPEFPNMAVFALFLILATIAVPISKKLLKKNVAHAAIFNSKTVKQPQILRGHEDINELCVFNPQRVYSLYATEAEKFSSSLLIGSRFAGWLSLTTQL